MANNIFINFLPPWIETGIQPAFYDKESGTVLQQTARMYAKVNELVESVNHQNTTIDEFIETITHDFNDLHDYVYDYFANLNVQVEINNKLEAMASDGSLYEIMEPYLNNLTAELNSDYEELSDNLTTQIDTINTKVNALTSISPIAVDSTDDMTDTSKIYLLTTDGNWYYWTGSAWSAGGSYESTPHALLSIVGQMVASNTITKDKLSDKINILSKATAIQTNKSVKTFVSGTGPTIVANTGTNVLTFPMSVLSDVVYFHIEQIRDSGNNNICYCKYNSTDLTSYALTNYVAVSGRAKEYNSTTKVATFKKDLTYDTLIITVDENFDIFVPEPIESDTWKTGENIMLNATNLVTESTLTRCMSLNGYTADHTPNDGFDYRFNKVMLQLTDANKLLLSSAYLYVASTPSEQSNRIILWKEGTGQTMYNLTYILGSSAYDSTTKLLDIYKLCGSHFNEYDYIAFYVPSTYNFPYLYTTYLTPANKNYELLQGLGAGTVILPSKFKAVENQNMCFYYQNFVSNANIDLFPLKQITNATINTDRVSWFNKDTATELSCTFQVRNDLMRNTFSLTKSFGMEIVPKSAGAGTTKKCLMIGDSLTQNGNYTKRLLDLFADDPMDIELLGTRGTGLNRHEGRSGWSTHDYVTNSTKNGFTNPFYNVSTDGFDFSYYMSQQDYDGVDYVFINLGTNDRGRQNDAIITDVNAMVTSILAYDPTIKVSLWLPPARGLCENVDQDNLLETFDTLKVNKLFIDTYDNNNDVNLIPIYTNINPYLDFPMVKAEISDTGSYDLVYTNNKVHPDVDGYYHIGDVIYAWIKSFAE